MTDGQRPARTSKVLGLEAALDVVRDGCTLAVGGLWFHNIPAAAMRCLARRGVRSLELITAPPSSFTADLLVGSGAVRRAFLPHVSFEHLGLAPNVRGAAQAGTLELVECDEATLLGGFLATVEGLPEHPVVSLKGTDHLRHSPLARTGRSSDGQPMIVPPALRADVAVLHAQEADQYGNVRNLGTPFADPLLAKIADYVVVTVDEVVDNEVVRSEPHRTTIPAYLVDLVVELPFGAHPGASHGRYPHDEQHLRRYLELCRAGEFAAYVAEWIDGPAGHSAYVERAGGADRLERLDEEVS